ncbi:MAG: MBL fold metallo-hydrolase [Candidatus Eisenbacteria bacterium]|nr:MBL fold metallo-hydrolase [Candidatus Latescibacterota bacterium]MBD3302701.1 MBL fold metallo-hydrolase [Candidatus Eisenbacteria bacterium]
MAVDSYALTFWGVRGSTPAPDPRMLRYGGNTTCVEIQVSPDHRILLDCGTGIRWLGHELATRPPRQRLNLDILLTHYHRDHLDGLPFFEPLHDPACAIAFHGYPWEGLSVERILEGAWTPPWFPFSLRDTEAERRFVDLDGRPFALGPFEVTTARLLHPLGVTAYRLTHASGSLVFATDLESGAPETNQPLLELARNAGTLIHDAQLTPEELGTGTGYGHSSWRQAAETARQAGVQRLILFHHGPRRTDEEIDRIVAATREIFPNTEAAREGRSITF